MLYMMKNLIILYDVITDHFNSKYGENSNNCDRKYYNKSDRSNGKSDYKSFNYERVITSFKFLFLY